MKRLIALLLCMLIPFSALSETLPVVTVQRAWPDGTKTTRAADVSRTSISLDIDPNMLICGVYPEAATARYELRHEYGPHELVKFNVHTVTHVEKYEGEKLLWCADITNYRVEKAWEMSEGVLLWGATDWSLDDYGVPRTHWISLLSHEGEVLWSHQMEGRDKLDDLDAALNNGDGTWTLLGTTGYSKEKQLLMLRLSADGTELNSSCSPLTDVGLDVAQSLGYGITWATRYEDGYLLHLCGYMYGYESLSYILQVRSDGTVAQIVCHDGDGQRFTWEDVCLIGDELWLSGYAVPLNSYEEDLQSAYTEISHILRDAYRRCFGWEVNLGLFSVNLGGKSVTSEWLTPQLRANYTALLLRCNAATGEVLAAFTVPECLGGSLEKDRSGGILWDVHRFVDSVYSPATSSFTIAATMQVYRCGFDDQGSFRWVMDTGECTDYRR